MNRARLLLSLLAVTCMVAGLLPAVMAPQEATASVSGPVVVRLYFQTRAEMNAVAARYDVWEVHHDQGYAVVMLDPDEYKELQSAGYRMELDLIKTAQVNGPLSIPGYPCYRTVEETFSTLQTLATTYPTLAELIDIGDSWDKYSPGGPAGYDMWNLIITNESIPGPKPRFFLMAEIHSREYVTAETATRFAEYLLQNYGTNPTITFFVDYNEIHIVPMTNPDGRKFAETGVWWRKNTNTSNGCSYPDYGIDLNRNHSFFWGCCGGSSGYPCDEVYRGPSRASEPETQAIQNYVASIIPDQNGNNGDDERPGAAPNNTTGIFITLHAYGQLILWPYGSTTVPAPNNAQLQTIGVKLATYNYHTPQPGWQLYTTDGTSEEWAYGKLGIAAYTFEMGDTFFEGCSSFEGTIWPRNRDALLYAWKIAETPYMTAYGPDALNPAVNPTSVPQGTPTQLTATINDSQNGGQNVAAAEYYVLPLHGATPPGDPGTGTPMQASDGNFNSPNEAVRATVDTTSLNPGSYIIAVRGKDSSNNWGPFVAVFLQVTQGVCDPPTSGVFDWTPTVPNPGQQVTFTGSADGTPAPTFAWDFGDGTLGSGATVSHTYSVAGDYTVVMTASNTCGEQVVTHVVSVVNPCDPPTNSAFTWSPIAPRSGQTVTLNGSADGTAPISYTWDLGDGTTATGSHPTHIYSDGGNYQVVMTVTNGCGVQSIQHLVSVCGVVHDLAFSWAPVTPQVSETVLFDGSASGGGLINYAWDFGDGTAGSGAAPSHAYGAAGNYTVVMTATNCQGASASLSHVITVTEEACVPAGNVAFSWDPLSPDPGQTVTFTGSASGDEPLGYSWDLGDSTTGSGTILTHTYTLPGTYTVVLTVTNCAGTGVSTVSHDVTVLELPVTYTIYLPVVIKNW